MSCTSVKCIICFTTNATMCLAYFRVCPFLFVTILAYARTSGILFFSSHVSMLLLSWQDDRCTNVCRLAGASIYATTTTKRKEKRTYPLNLLSVQKYLRIQLPISGLDEVYDISDEQQGRRARKLHRLTTHSLRHYAITRFAKNTNGNLILTSRFARHVDPSTTSIYISTSKQEVYDVIDAMAVDEVAALKKRVGR